MSAPLTDIHFQNLINFGLKTILSDPDRYLKDIFGGYNSKENTAFYGTRTLDQIKKWIQTTKIPVILGFDLVDTQLPAVTIHLLGSTPTQTYLGDTSLTLSEDILTQARDVLIPAFKPLDAIWSGDLGSLQLVLPSSLSFVQTELFVPDVLIRDAKGREYSISRDDDANIIVSTFTDKHPIDQIDLTSLELVSPVYEARYNTGAMTFQETISIVIHGNASRAEGIWLYSMVMWILLRYRPLLTATGMDLSKPSASDFSKANEFLGENVWRRYITVQAVTNWSWTAARQKDILGYLVNVTDTQ